jgi:hypothetical protein
MKQFKRTITALIAVLIITGMCACELHTSYEDVDPTVLPEQPVATENAGNFEETSENEEISVNTGSSGESNISDSGSYEYSEEISSEENRRIGSEPAEDQEVVNEEDVKANESSSIQENDISEESAESEMQDTTHHEEEQNKISDEGNDDSLNEEEISGEKASDETSSADETEENSTFSEVGDGNFLIITSDGSVTKDGNTYTILTSGTYTLSGTLDNGQIIVNAGDEDEVEIELNGASVSCSFDSPVYVMNADKIKIKATEGTVNNITDERSYIAQDSDTEGSAAIYALCDLNLSGAGVLNVTAKSYNNGVQTKDDLKIKDVTLSVTAPNNAIKGNDSVTVESGEITAVSTGGDAIKTDNSDISSKGNQKGTVTVSGGTLTLTASDDGIDAAYDVVIAGGSVTVVDAGGKGIAANNSIDISGGEITVLRSSDDAIHANNDNALENGSDPTGNITVSGGSVTIAYTADDGIHADGTLLITDGNIDIEYSHEGLEGHYITVEGGNVYVYADDDALNATSSSNWSSDGMITVSGGHVVAEVSGRDVDGIDSNGSYLQTGGFVAVSNPNADSNGNMSAMDIDSNISVTGGILVALGNVPGSANGMIGGRGGGMGGFGGHQGGGFGGPQGGGFGAGGLGSSSLPQGYVVYSGNLNSGAHTFTFEGTEYSFTLKNAVSNGWIWADGINDSNYSLK